MSILRINYNLVILTYHLIIIVTLLSMSIDRPFIVLTETKFSSIIFTFYSDQLTIDVETGIVTK